MTQAVVVGIDIAKDSFDATLTVEGKSWHEHFENNPGGFNQFGLWVGKHTKAVVHACMEATGQYGDALAEILYTNGWQVSVVNPARIKAYGNSKMRRNKTDKADAQLIAEYCLRENPPLWSPPSASFKGLQALVRRLDDLQANWQQENNRLQSGGTDPQVIEDIKEHMEFLHKKITKVKEDIQKRIDQDPKLKERQELLTSVTGIGELTAARIQGEIRDICDFDGARQLSAYAGVTPRNFVSGTSVHKKARMSKMGNVNLRKALYMSAVSAKRFNPIVRAFCQRLLEKGLKPLEVIGAAMHKLLHLIYGILKSGKPFDPDFLTKHAPISAKPQIEMPAAGPGA
jgi:transposase